MAKKKENDLEVSPVTTHGGGGVKLRVPPVLKGTMPTKELQRAKGAAVDAEKDWQRLRAEIEQRRAGQATTTPTQPTAQPTAQPTEPVTAPSSIMAKPSLDSLAGGGLPFSGQQVRHPSSAPPAPTQQGGQAPTIPQLPGSAERASLLASLGDAKAGKAGGTNKTRTTRQGDPASIWAPNQSSVLEQPSGAAPAPAAPAPASPEKDQKPSPGTSATELGQRLDTESKLFDLDMQGVASATATANELEAANAREKSRIDSTIASRDPKRRFPNFAEWQASTGGTAEEYRKQAGDRAWFGEGDRPEGYEPGARTNEVMQGHQYGIGATPDTSPQYSDLEAMAAEADAAGRTGTEAQNILERQKDALVGLPIDENATEEEKQKAILDRILSGVNPRDGRTAEGAAQADEQMAQLEKIMPPEEFADLQARQLGRPDNITPSAWNKAMVKKQEREARAQLRAIDTDAARRNGTTPEIESQKRDAAKSLRGRDLTPQELQQQNAQAEARKGKWEAQQNVLTSEYESLTKLAQSTLESGGDATELRDQLKANTAARKKHAEEYPLLGIQDPLARATIRQAQEEGLEAVSPEQLELINQLEVLMNLKVGGRKLTDIASSYMD